MNERTNEIPLLLYVAKYLAKPWIKEKYLLKSSIFHEHVQFFIPINIFKILLKSSHNIESNLSSSIFLSHGLNATLINNFFTCLWQKKIPMSWTTETTIFIRIIARIFIQRKQPYLWFIVNNDRNML